MEKTSYFRFEYGIGALHGFPALHGFSTRKRGQGDYSFDRLEEVDREEPSIYDVLLVSPTEVVAMNTQHGNKVAVVSRDTCGQGVDADALITDEPGVALVAHVADCFPIYVTERNGRTVALIHAGRKGTEAGVTRAALRSFFEVSHARAAAVRILIGPGICAECYTHDILTPNLEQLAEAGIRDVCITVAKLCTCCARAPMVKAGYLFPSHYRWWKYENKEGPDARLTALIARSHASMRE